METEMAKTDEETVQSQDTSAKAETTQTEEVQGEEVEQEPTPYKNAYHKDLDKEDPESDPSVDTEATQKDEGFASSQPPVEHDFKKRYDDLKTHYDNKLNEWKQEKQTLEAQAKATQAEPANLKSSEELDNFKDEYPDVYSVVETVAKKQADSRVSKLESEIQGLKQSEQNLVRESAQTELLSVHPDFLDIKDTDEFNAWLSDQPTSISDGITKNGTDSKWAVRVLDLYKSDAGNASTTSKSDLKSAAQAVTKTKPVQYSAKAGNKKIWKQSEIRKLKPHEFENLEKEIDLAAKEGRVSAD
jgi:uncharacterized protein YutD